LAELADRGSRAFHEGRHPVQDQPAGGDVHMRIWDAGKAGAAPHAPSVLESNGGFRLIAVQLPTGEDLGDHETHEGAVAVVTRGRVTVEGRDADSGREVGQGGVVAFAPGERRSITAVADTDLVLMFAPWPAEDRRLA
jgi:quercetin dioxygenase-like cupin family protein